MEEIPKEIPKEELEAQSVELLPDREEMQALHVFPSGHVIVGEALHVFPSGHVMIG